MSYGLNQYGVLKYGEEPITPEDITHHKPDLMQYLPKYYFDVYEAEQIQDTISNELGLQRFLIEDLLRQFFVDTATWGLYAWEQTFGIRVNTSLTYESRREVIKAKMRGTGTTTKAMVEDVAMAFSGGEVRVIEYPRESRFVIQFVGIKGIPQNMDGLINTIDNIKPAHLAYSFKYTYTVWNFISGVWNDFSAKTWNDLRIYEGE